MVKPIYLLNFFPYEITLRASRHENWFTTSFHLIAAGLDQGRSELGQRHTNDPPGLVE